MKMIIQNQPSSLPCGDEQNGAAKAAASRFTFPECTERGCHLAGSDPLLCAKTVDIEFAFFTEEQVGRRQLCLPNDGNIITNSKIVVKIFDIDIFI